MKAILLAALMLSGAAHAQLAEDYGPVSTGACVGPHVDFVVPGDDKHIVPDRVYGVQPVTYTMPEGPVSGKLPAGGSYSVEAVQRGYAQLVASRYARPLPSGAAVGWVQVSDVHTLASHNCN